MLALAQEIRNNLQTLTEQYVQLLVEIPTYAEMPAGDRQEAARNAILLIAAGLEAGDHALFAQFVRAVALERVAQGIDVSVVQQALNCLVEIVEPLFPDIQTANFLWRAMIQVNAALSELTLEKRQSAEERFRRLAENTQDGVTIIEGNQVVYINGRLSKMLGYSTEELKKMSSLDFAAPEEKERLQTIMVQARQTGQSLEELEFWAVRKDGTRCYLRNRYSLSREGETITGRYVFTTDLTADKEAEEAIRQSEARYRALFERATDAIFLENENDEIVDVNQRACDLLGYSREELLQMRVPDLQAPEVRQAGGQAIKRELDQYHGAIFEAVDMHRDGTRISVEVSTTSLGGGLVLSVVRDITERKQAAEELQQQQAFLRQVIDLNPNLIFVKDRESRFVLANRALAEMYGTSVEGLIGKSDADFTEPEQARLFHLDDLWVMDSLQERVIPDRLLTDAEGNLHWVQAIKRPLVDEDGVARRVLGISTDISARKQLEEQIRGLLERRGQQVRTSTEIAQEIAAAPALGELFERVVTLIKERFDYYHAQIFRYEPEIDAVVLVTGYGEAGRVLLREGHRLKMGRGVVGTAAATGRPVLAADVRQDPDWVRNPHLPQTQGELAVPITLRDTVLGILDVQSEQAGALTEDDQLLLEGLCGQIAIAIESTRLQQEMEESLRELERLYRAISREGWLAFQAEERPTGYRFDRRDVIRQDDPWLPQVRQAIQQGTLSTRVSDEAAAAVAPLAVRGQVFGALGVEDDPAHPLSADDLALLESISEQVAQALESARLFDEQQRARAQLDARVQELDCLNDIGRQIDQVPPIPEFLDWVAERIPRAMQYPENCRVALEYQGQVYGVAEALGLAQQMVQGIQVGGQQMGRVCIAYTERREFLDEESALLGDIARRVSGYVENRRLFEQARIRLEELAVLNELGQALTARLRVEEVLNEAYRQASRLVDTTNFYIALYDREKEEIHFAFDVTDSAIDSKISVIPAGQGIAGYIIRNRTSVLFSENVKAQQNKLGISMVGEESLSWLGVPLVVGDQVLGAMAVHSLTTPGLYTEHDRDLLTAIASTTAISIQNARLLEETQTRAEQERLTRTITDQIRRGVDREAILRIAVRELGSMLGASQAVIRLGTPEQLLADREGSLQDTQ